MRLKFARSNVASHGLASALGMIVAWTALPLWRQAIMTIHQEPYGQLVEQCDMAMQDHFSAKQEAMRRPSERSAALVSAGEVGLITCQDYDLYQKRLLQWGLSENELAQMRLTAVEARSSDLTEVVSTHEIRY